MNTVNSDLKGLPIQGYRTDKDNPENPTILEIALVKTGSGKAQIQAVVKDVPDILLFPYSHETLNALLTSFLSGKPMQTKIEKQKRHV
jgi:hypothetical protein